MFSLNLRNIIGFKLIGSKTCFSSATHSVSKLDLSKLRKVSGFPISKCKEALIKCNSSVEEAHEWLKSEAAKHGWQKMGKLAERPMSNGLVGMQINTNKDFSCGVMLELNCETDFVARNHNFHKCLHIATSAFMEHISELTDINKIQLNSEDIKGLLYLDANSSQKETLDHLLAVNVGSIGENMLFRRAVCLKASGNSHLSLYTHLSWPDINKKWKETTIGKYGVILKYKPKDETQVNETWTKNAVNTANSICQHIVGLHPVKIGDSETDKPNVIIDNEDTLIYQRFLHDDNVRIIDILEENSLIIEDFTRFNCGELATFS